MLTNETELKADVREFTGYTSVQVLSDDGLDTAYRTAKRHCRVAKNLDADFEYYNTNFPARQDALFWWTCLFTKVQTGELDSQDLQMGAIDQKTLLAKGNNEMTMWYRNAVGALQSLNPGGIVQVGGPSRADREYNPDSFDTESGSGGGSTDDLDI